MELIMLFLISPFLEETLFRKHFFEFLKGKNQILPYALVHVSSCMILFVIVHYKPRLGTSVLTHGLCNALSFLG